jgi:hypothetical protein
VPAQTAPLHELRFALKRWLRCAGMIRRDRLGYTALLPAALAFRLGMVYDRWAVVAEFAQLLRDALFFRAGTFFSRWVNHGIQSFNERTLMHNASVVYRLSHLRRWYRWTALRIMRLYTQRIRLAEAWLRTFFAVWHTIVRPARRRAYILAFARATNTHDPEVAHFLY